MKQMEDQTAMFPGQNKDRYTPTTKSGHSLSLCVSALQKCIRRGLEKEAGYFAIELIESGYTNYLLDRLVVIAHEDVGDTQLCVHALSLANFMKQYKKDKKQFPDHNTIMLLIVNLCRSPKNRIGDDYKVYIEEQRREGYQPEITEWMADFHTFEGKQRLGNISKEQKVKMWKEELTKVNVEVPNEYKDLWKSW